MREGIPLKYVSSTLTRLICSIIHTTAESVYMVWYQFHKSHPEQATSLQRMTQHLLD